MAVLPQLRYRLPRQPYSRPLRAYDGMGGPASRGNRTRRRVVPHWLCVPSEHLSAAIGQRVIMADRDEANQCVDNPLVAGSEPSTPHQMVPYWAMHSLCGRRIGARRHIRPRAASPVGVAVTKTMANYRVMLYGCAVRDRATHVMEPADPPVTQSAEKMTPWQR